VAQRIRISPINYHDTHTDNAPGLYASGYIIEGRLGRT